MKETFKVEMDIEMMQDVISIAEYMRKYPNQKSEFHKFSRQLSNIIQNGCFKHNLIRKTFKTSPNESISMCPKCSPKEYKEHEENNSRTI